MNTCPSCGKMSGIHGSVLQGCMCQYSMQTPVMREGKDFTISKPWVGLTDEEKKNIFLKWYGKHWTYTEQVQSVMDSVEAKLKEKNT